MGRRSRLSPWKYATFAIITLMLSAVVISAALLGLDLDLHKRYERRWGLNVWGYRGSVVGPKRPGEVRIVVLAEVQRSGSACLPIRRFRRTSKRS